jgi:hypothetical protein
METPRPRPSLQDWLLLAIGVAFVCAGLIILPCRDGAPTQTTKIYAVAQPCDNQAQCEMLTRVAKQY